VTRKDQGSTGRARGRAERVIEDIRIPAFDEENLVGSGIRVELLVSSRRSTSKTVAYSSAFDAVRGLGAQFGYSERQSGSADVGQGKMTRPRILGSHLLQLQP
jgi:hypothetical protein